MALRLSQLCHFLPESDEPGGKSNPPQGREVNLEPASVALRPGISQVAPVGAPRSTAWCHSTCCSEGPQCDGGWDLVVLESKDWAEDLAPAQHRVSPFFFSIMQVLISVCNLTQ